MWFKVAFSSGYYNVVQTKALQSSKSLVRMRKFLLANLIEKGAGGCPLRDADGRFVFKVDETLYKSEGFRHYLREVRSYFVHSIISFYVLRLLLCQ